MTDELKQALEAAKKWECAPHIQDGDAEAMHFHADAIIQNLVAAVEVLRKELFSDECVIVEADIDAKLLDILKGKNDDD